MAFWCRIGKAKVKQFSHQFKTIPYGSLLHHTFSNSKPCLTHNSSSITINTKPTHFCSNLRFYAAPVQFQNKPNKDDKKAGEPRLNEKITAEVVRLVMEKEHAIISRREALERARRLNLDLVEVQGNANPPVCKIMDYHREKYQKQVKDKDRAKSKPEMRTGSSKEVRFSGKTEQKDLQMKADTVKRLMEEGYRVKCFAKGSVDQDVLGILSRLSVLIEDVAVVESGPLLGKDGAYVIVRHVKFGLKKGGGKKLVKALEDASSGDQKASSTPASDSCGVTDDISDSESGYETNDESQARFSSPVSYNRNIHSFRDSTSSSESSDISENRYRKGGARNQFPSPNGMENKNKGISDSTRLGSHFSNQGRQPPRDTKFSQQTREANAPRFRNYEPPQNDGTKREPFSPSAPSTPRSGYGIFSGSRANTPGNHGVDTKIGENKEGNRYPARSPATRGDLASNQNLHGSNSEGRQPRVDTSRQGGYGVFSR